MQFTPESWVRVRWHELPNIKRFLGVNFVIVCLATVELNAFALKQVLWIPPENNTVSVHLFKYFFVQKYIFIDGRTQIICLYLRLLCVT